MDRNSAEVGWSDEQWSRVVTTIQQEAGKASASGKFLSTCLYPDKTAIAVPDNTLGMNLGAALAPNRRLVVDHTPTTFFTSLAINVALTSQEVADPDLQGGLIQFRRAVNLIKRVEDALIFRGQPGAGLMPAGVAGLPPVFDIGSGGRQPGLYGAAPYIPRLDETVAPGGIGPGFNLGLAIIDAIGDLEGAGHNGPFACVLDHDYFRDLHTPAVGLVLPVDRVKPFLEGPLLRTSTLLQNTGLVIALGGTPPELVISSELHVRFLQITPEPRYVFRVSERVALRVPDWTSIVVLHGEPHEQ
jgi:Encapsulating protein for peroxidase